LRTDFLIACVMMVLVSCVFYKRNIVLTNTVLIVLGIIISQIGFRGQGAAETNFLTFDQPWLYSGIPLISILAGLFGIPEIVKSLKWTVPESFTNIAAESKSPRFSLASSLRGGLIGICCGLLPGIGTIISSSVAHTVESKIHKQNTPYDALCRLTSAESANNSSLVIVLVPLLAIGLALIPSEMFLYSILQVKNWYPGEETYSLLGLNIYQLLIASLTITGIVSFFMCYSLVLLTNRWLYNNLKLLNFIALSVMTFGIIYAGSLEMNIIFFLGCFAILSIVGVWFIEISFVPLIAGYFLGSPLIDGLVVLHQLYIV